MRRNFEKVEDAIAEVAVAIRDLGNADAATHKMKTMGVELKKTSLPKEIAVKL
jgi:hypothetical protein